MRINKKNLIVFLISFLLVGIGFVIIYKNVGIYYAINDDTSMRDIVSGAIDGTHESHIVFIYYIIGVFLSWLYMLKSGIDWYGLFMLGVFAVSLSIIISKLYIVASKKKRYGLFLCTLLLILILMFRHIVEFQWTVVAVLPAIAVIVLLILKEERYVFDAETVVIIALSLVSFSIRQTVFYLALPMIGFIIVGYYLIPLMKNSIKNDDRKKILSVIAPIGIILFFMFLIVKQNTMAYQDEAWKEYKVFNSARAEIQDYGNFLPYEGNEQFYDEIGFRKEDVAMLPQFGLMMNFDSAQMRSIADYFNEQKSERSMEEKIDLTIEVVKSVFLNETYTEMHCIMFSLLGLFLVYAFIYKKNLLIKIGILLLQVAILLFLAYMGRFPARIVTIYDFYMIFFCLTVIYDEIKIDDRSNFGKKCVYILLILLLGQISVDDINTRINKTVEYEKKVLLYDEINSYVEAQNGEIVVVSTGTFNTKERFVVHKEAKVYCKIGTAGWSSHSPYSIRKREMLGIDSNEMFLLKDNIQYMTIDLDKAQRVCDYYSLHSDKLVGYEIVNCVTFSNGNTVYVCKFFEY